MVLITLPAVAVRIKLKSRFDMKLEGKKNQYLPINYDRVSIKGYITNISIAVNIVHSSIKLFY